MKRYIENVIKHPLLGRGLGRLFLFISLLSFSPVRAQVFVGYLGYDELLKAMPQYAIVEQQMADMQQAYDLELKRVEDEFNQKYEAFLEGRKDFPRTIMLKRQTELQQLLERNVEFKEKSRQELAQARVQALAPLRAQLNETIATIARERGLIVVVNTDSNACPFIEPANAVDINLEVLQKLNTER